jgi:hypothetical protein
VFGGTSAVVTYSEGTTFRTGDTVHDQKGRYGEPSVAAFTPGAGFAS